jgi:hypothetical protein
MYAENKSMDDIKWNDGLQVKPGTGVLSSWNGNRVYLLKSKTSNQPSSIIGLCNERYATVHAKGFRIPIHMYNNGKGITLSLRDIHITKFKVAEVSSWIQDGRLYRLGDSFMTACSVSALEAIGML